MLGDLEPVINPLSAYSLLTHVGFRAVISKRLRAGDEPRAIQYTPGSGCMTWDDISFSQPRNLLVDTGGGLSLIHI